MKTVVSIFQSIQLSLPATETQLARVHDMDCIREIFDAVPETEELHRVEGDRLQVYR